jgi:hypothetical protein
MQTISVCAAWTREQWAAALPQPIPAEVALSDPDTAACVYRSISL